MGKTPLLPSVACAMLLISPHARAKQAAEDGYQPATVISVVKHGLNLNYAGENPSDAPLQPREYSYDIGIRLNCTLYIGRYESATNYLPSVFAPHHGVDIRLHKHVMYVSLPFTDDEVMLGVVGHRRVKDEVCLEAAPQAAIGHISNHQLTASKSKGGLV
jgi:hypothetical protein